MTRNGTTVLVVEDEAFVRMDIVACLEDEGFTVYEACDADEAIEVLNAHTEIHVVFTDIDMPGSMDGLKLAEAVRDRWPPIHVIVTSGHRQITDATLPVKGRVFSKPYAQTSIVKAIREMIALA